MGKSTLATLVANEWHCEALDTDEELARFVGCAAPEHLRRVGPTAFRQSELAALSRVVERDAVIATGGGIVSLAPARAILRREVTFWLDGDDDVLVSRLGDGDRPLLGDPIKPSLRALRAEREAWYLEVARVRIDAGGAPREVLTRIIEAWSSVSS